MLIRMCGNALDINGCTVYLLYWYKRTNTDAFTGTKVQILTQLGINSEEETDGLTALHMAAQVPCKLDKLDVLVPTVGYSSTSVGGSFSCILRRSTGLDEIAIIKALFRCYSGAIKALTAVHMGCVYGGTVRARRNRVPSPRSGGQCQRPR